MKSLRFALTVLPIALSGLIGLSSISGARAAQIYTFEVAANDGYGVQDCLADGGECGQVVADAWCEAHGHGPATSFGPRRSVAGVAATTISTASDSYAITCGD